MTEDRAKPAAASAVRLPAFAFAGGRGYPCVVVAVDSSGCQIELTRDVRLAPHIHLHVVGHTAGRRAFVEWQHGPVVRLAFDEPPPDVVEI